MQAPHHEHLESKVIVEEPYVASNLDLADKFEHSEVLSELGGCTQMIPRSQTRTSLMILNPLQGYVAVGGLTKEPVHSTLAF